VACSAEHLPFGDGAFGAAAAIAVLEHVPDERRALRELARVTRPGGQVFLAVPNSVERMPFPLHPPRNLQKSQRECQLFRTRSMRVY